MPHIRKIPFTISSAFIVEIPSKSATPEQEFIPRVGSQLINSILHP